MPSAQFTLMEGLGHFPMTERSDCFTEYLRPVLTEVVRIE